MTVDHRISSKQGLSSNYEANKLTNNLAKIILFDDLRGRILDYFSSYTGGDPSRRDLIDFLDILSIKLESILYAEEEQVGKHLVQHPAVYCLIYLADLLRDLENGKTAELFKPYPFGATATLRSAEQRDYEVLEAAILISQKAFNLRSETAAAKLVSEKLNKAGRKRRNGLPYTPEFLRKLRHRTRKQTPSKRR
jgi:hypothetical protein